MLLEDFLGLIGAVEGLAIGVLAGTRVIAAHNEVTDAVVLADEGVPDGFAWSAHAHSERQQRKLGGGLREL